MHFKLPSSVFAAVFVAAASAQKHTGELFNFVPGLGACDKHNSDTDTMVSVSNHTFTIFPGATLNPNRNPICKHNLTITHGNVTLTAPIVDYCAHCGDTKAVSWEIV